ncbi:MAG: hypothetical protein AB8F34_12500 [Akkermansiaceae bacterium]
MLHTADKFPEASMSIIEKLQRIAQTIQILRLPAIAVGLISLASIVVIIITSESHEGDRFLIPSFVGLLWAMSTYSFIVVFRSVPEKASKTLSLFSKLKRTINRGLHLLIGVVFIGTTVFALIVTYKLISIWMKDLGS